MSEKYVFLGRYYVDNAGFVSGIERDEDASRLQCMLREARAEGDALAIDWLETLQQAVRTE